MFDGVPDQLQQFIASAAAARTRTHLPLPLSFPSLHNLASSNGFTPFDPLFTSNNSHHHQVPPQLQQPHFLHPLHHQHQPCQKNNEEKDENTSLVGMNMEIERERSMADEPIDTHQPWSNDEVLALLRIRSSMENWFPEFTWEHVSRKLAELGFKRRAEKCKEKFEEESRYFNSINCSKNYRIFSELEDLCQGENPPLSQPHHHHIQQVVAAEKNKNVEKSRENEDNMGQNLEGDSRNIDEYQTSAGNNASDQDNEKVVENKANNNKINISNKKRKRQKKFEMLKGFCEDIVNKLMNQQEEMHSKLLEDMVKRDEEKVAREEAWKKQELDRLKQELELRAKEQAIAGDRQATIIKFLSKFSSTGSSKKQCFGRSNEDLVKVTNEYSNPPSTSSSLVPPLNPNPTVNNQNKVDQVSTTTSSTMILGHQNSGSCTTQNNQIKPTSMTETQAPENPNPKTPTSSKLALAPQNPNSVNAQSNPLSPTSPLTVKKAPQNPPSNDKEDPGQRWPRDEVLTLINLRCSLYNNGDHNKEGAVIKAPLWERISQGMLELGYKRSAKRCKEKWENINKYFRKTKDVNKKRSLDSRTCPYFHQLSTLYNQGALIAPSEGPENHLDLPETGIDSSQKGAKDSTLNVSEGDTNMVQLPAFEFEF
ncbi:trihelix transcription factor GTL2-like [Durio zibethinus]|uniref:Trihelix transcription factor GTL2-like n=1 Tax=Durio zibethinus TaxID=66656 RepID=A0A6P5WVD4_DURZI|nr:trihelix transcription factor GTL2-like [Durio zibethinus]